MDKKKKIFYNLVYLHNFFFKIYNKINLRSNLKSKNISYRFKKSNEDPGLIKWIYSIKPDIRIVYSMHIY